jgi:hypothetical protein
MRKNSTLAKIITPVGLVGGGAQRGRRCVGTAPTDGTKIYDCQVPLNGDYDRGGAYWGGGKNSRPLRVRYTRDLEYIEFYRGYKK